MVAAIRWTNATGDGDFSVLGNWIDLATGAVPVSAFGNGDTWIFDRGESVPSSNNTGRSQTGILVVTTPEFAGSLVLGTTSFASIRHDAGNLTLTGTITKGDIRCRRGTKFTYVSGTATDLYTEADCDISGVVTNGRHEKNYKVVYAASGTGLTICEVEDGCEVTSLRSGVFNIQSGSMLHLKAAATLSDLSEIGNRGRLRYESTADIPGIVRAKPKSVLDFSPCPVVPAFATLHRWPGADIRLDTRAGRIAPSAEVAYGLEVGTAGFEGASPFGG